MAGQTEGPPFVFIGGHACVDWVNTVIADGGEEVDLVRTFSDLARWLAEARLASPEVARLLAGMGGKAAAETVEAAKTFRGVLRKGLERMRSSRDVPATLVESVNQRLAQPLSVRSRLVRKEGRLEKQSEAVLDHPARVLSLLAERAADFLAHVDPGLVEKCANPACILYFYDTSKNHTRRWCSMQVCGNRMKVAAHQRRGRSAGKD